MSGCNISNANFNKTICPICYEDLKPDIEDLQCIFICGHVFHELCLQQWLEYCSEKKKSTCPVCKQRCAQENVVRLYFQSIGDSNYSNNLTQKAPNGVLGEEGEDPVALRREVKKLQAKLSGLSSTFERQQQDLKLLNDELCQCKEEAKKEAALKNEALRQKASLQQLLGSKTEELVKASSQCSRLQDSNMALAKELAALKLVSDLNLEEEEVLKLASFGHGTNSKDTIDILKKSLMLRNKSYKELMTQCNLLGRGETRSLKKLEKAKEKIKKLKTRVQELELALEEKENKALRALKVPKRTSSMGTDVNGVKLNSDTQHVTQDSMGNQMEPSVLPLKNSTESTELTKRPSSVTRMGNSECQQDWGLNTAEDTDISEIDLERQYKFSIDKNVSKPSPPLPKHSSPVLKPHDTCFGEDICLKKTCVQNQKVVSNISKEIPVHEKRNSNGLSVSRTIPDNVDNVSIDAMVEDLIEISNPRSASEIFQINEVVESQPLLHIRKDNLNTVPTSAPGDRCFAGGIVGPDGGKRYLGKWCKRAQTKASGSPSLRAQGSNAGSGDLIAVGADGRGGMIKVLRSQNHLEASKGSFPLAKRCKYGAKQSNYQSQGCLQIEHFFGKVDQKL